MILLLTIRNLHDSAFDTNNIILETQENDFFPAMKKNKRK